MDRNKIMVPQMPAPNKIEAPSSVDLVLLDRRVKQLDKKHRQLIEQVNAYTQAANDAVRIITQAMRRVDAIEAELADVTRQLEEFGVVEDRTTRKRKRKP